MLFQISRIILRVLSFALREEFLSFGFLTLLLFSFLSLRRSYLSCLSLSCFGGRDTDGGRGRDGGHT